MSTPNQNKRARMLPMLALSVASAFVLERSGPVIAYGEINEVAAIAACLLALSSFRLLADIFWFAGKFFDWVKAKTPTGLKGTAGWVKSLRELKKDLIKHGWGPYWGVFKGKEIIADFESSAYAVGPSGSGKSTRIIQTNVLALKGVSKTVFDFKSDLTPVLIKILRARGENIRILNLGNLYTDLVGPSGEYSPLCLIADLFWQDGGLLDISDTLFELCLQLYPERKSKNSSNDNEYFRDGSREFIGMAILLCVLVDGYNATLGDVLQMLNDRESFLKHALWLCGRLTSENEFGEPETVPPMPIHESPWYDRHDEEERENFVEYVRGLASGIASLLQSPDSRTADPFITGAKQALARFNITTRAHQKTRRTTFRFAEQKEGDKPTTIFIMLDPNKIEAQAPVLGLIQWCMGMEIRRHPNKHRPVYLLADEAANLPWSGLGSLLTWCRAYSLRLFLVFQNFPTFAEAHGEATLEILHSECEIKLFLPGQRNPKTLKDIEGILAQQSVMVKSNSGNREKNTFGVDGFNYREEGRPLMTADEIRRTKDAILLIRDNKPMKVSLPSIAAIAPWRKQIADNPFYGKPYLKKVEFRFGSRKGGPLTRLRSFLSSVFKKGE